MKKCYKCKKEKPLSEFSKNLSKKDGLSSQCRECHKQLRHNHYLKNKKKIIKQISNLKIEKQKWVISLKDKPCKDCGKKYPHYVMEFDHLGDKEFSISNGTLRCLSKKRILEEMSKCELVCANCHRERTYRRGIGV